MGRSPKELPVIGSEIGLIFLLFSEMGSEKGKAEGLDILGKDGGAGVRFPLGRDGNFETDRLGKFTKILHMGFPFHQCQVTVFRLQPLE